MSHKKSIFLATTSTLILVAGTAFAGPPEGKGKGNKNKKSKHKVERVQDDMKQHGKKKAKDAQERSYENRRDGEHRMDDGQGRDKGQMRAEEAKAKSEDRRRDREHRMDDERGNGKMKDKVKKDRGNDLDDDRGAGKEKAKQVKAERTSETANGKGKKKGWFASWRERRAARKAEKKRAKEENS